MSARDDVYANIRRSLAVSGREATRRAAVEQRLSLTPRGIVPERGSLDPAGRLALFQAEAEAAAASVVRVAEPTAIANEVSRYLRMHNLAPALRLALDPRVAAAAFVEIGLTVETGRAEATLMRPP